ncbi:MAG: hypothetical protein KGL53_02605 [Elusimicrobia bacterium]|nr:hypothetical protein [Elusimicrobiota bacterium]
MNTLTERFPRAKTTWLDAVRPEGAVVSRSRSVIYVPRLQRKHPLKSRLSGNVY